MTGTPVGVRSPAQRFDVVSADGTRITAWHNAGDPGALPVVVSNGLGTPPEAWPAVLAERARFRAVGWYHRGTAGGARPADPTHIRVQDHVEDLLAVMDAQGLERAVLASWSLGVAVAFETARLHPDRVAGVLAVAGAPGGTFRAMGQPLGVPVSLRHPLGTSVARVLRLGGPALALVAKALPMTPMTARVIAHTGVVLPRATPDVLLPALREFRRHDWGWYMTLALGAAAHEPMDLSFVRVPTTLIAGRFDVLASYKVMRALVEQMPHAELKVLPGSHFLPLEFPAECADALADLGARCGLAG